MNVLMKIVSVILIISLTACSSVKMIPIKYINYAKEEIEGKNIKFVAKIVLKNGVEIEGVKHITFKDSTISFSGLNQIVNKDSTSTKDSTEFVQTLKDVHSIAFLKSKSAIAQGFGYGVLSGLVLGGLSIPKDTSNDDEDEELGLDDAFEGLRPISTAATFLLIFSGVTIVGAIIGASIDIDETYILEDKER